MVWHVWARIVDATEQGQNDQTIRLDPQLVRHLDNSIFEGTALCDGHLVMNQPSSRDQQGNVTSTNFGAIQQHATKCPSVAGPNPLNFRTGQYLR